jgi:hypothetical protein
LKVYRKYLDEEKADRNGLIRTFHRTEDPVAYAGRHGGSCDSPVRDVGLGVRRRI